jgi:hypothetical protein
MKTSRLLTVACLAVVWGTPAPAAEIDRCLPDDTDAVLSVNVKQLLHAPLFKKHAAKHVEQACQHPSVRAALDGLGLSPLQDIDRVTLAPYDAPGKGPDLPETIVVCRGRFDTAKFHAYLRKAAKEDGRHVKLHKAGELKCYEIVGPGKHGSLMIGSGVNTEKGPVFAWKATGPLLDTIDTFYVALADKNTLVLASSLDALRVACAQAARTGKPAPGSPLRDLLDNLDGKQTVCFAARGRALFKQPAGEEQQEEGPEPPLDSLTGSVAVKDGIELRCTVTARSPDGARAIMKVLDDLRARAAGLAVVLAGNQKKYAFLKEVPKTFGATRKDATILLEGRLSGELLEKLAALVRKDD